MSSLKHLLKQIDWLRNNTLEKYVRGDNVEIEFLTPEQLEYRIKRQNLFNKLAYKRVNSKIRKDRIK